MSRLISLATAALAMLVTAFLQFSKPALSVEQLGEIHVVAPAQSLITRNLPGESVRVLTRDLWEGRDATLADVLDEVAGVTIARTGGEGSLTTVGMRGAGGNQVLLMLNGVPVSLPGGLAVDFSLIDLESVERIEVIKGGATFGSRAVGGVINIITRGQQVLLSGTSLALSQGSFGTSEGCWQRARTQADGQSLLLLSGFTTEGDFDFARINGSIRSRQNNRARRASLLWERQRFSSRTLTSSFAHVAVLRRGVPGFAEFPTLQARLTEAIGTVGWNRLIEPEDAEDWSREARLSLSSSHLRFHDPDPAIGPPIHNRNTNLSARAEFVLMEKPPSSTYPRSQVAVAVDEEWLRGTDYGHRRQTRAALSLARSFQFGRATITPAVSASAAEGSGANGSWELAVQQELGDDLIASASFGHSFRFPDFNELYYPNEGYVRGNPALGSERAYFADVGIGIERPRFSMDIHCFHRRQHNTIKFVPVSAYTIEPRNLPSVRVNGVELEASVRPDKHLSGHASYTITRASFRDSHLPLTQTPKYKAAAVLSYRNGALALSASHWRESAQTSDLFGSIRVPAQRRTDISASWRGKHNEWALAVQNVFDESGRDFWDLPLPGRYIEISLKHSF